MKANVAWVCGLLVCGVWRLPALGTAEIQKRVPVRFSYESGNGHFDEDTGWLTLVPYWSQFHGYLRASSIPYGFSASAYLVYAFSPAEVYPGNVFACRVWLEPMDDPGITELYSESTCRWRTTASRISVMRRTRS